MENEKSPNRAFFVLHFSFSLPDCSVCENISLQTYQHKKQAVWFFLHIACFVFSYWNGLESLLCKQISCIIKWRDIKSILYMTLTGINIRFLYLICGAKYGGFSSVQVYPKSYCIQHKTKRYSFHPYRLMFIFFQRRQHGCHMAFSLPEFVHRIAPPMRTHEK